MISHTRSYTDGPLLANKKYKELLEPFQVRAAAVQSYLALLRPSLKVEVHRLHDVAGPAATDPLLQAIIVSKETLAGVQVVQSQRAGNQLNQLASLCVPLILPPPSLVYESHTSPYFILLYMVGDAGHIQWTGVKSVRRPSGPRKPLSWPKSRQNRTYTLIETLYCTTSN